MSERYYHGTKVDLSLGDLIDGVAVVGSFDAASWQSELAPGDGPGRIYVVEPTGITSETSGEPYPVPTTWFRSDDPLRVVEIATDPEGRPWRLYHGTKADLQMGDLLKPGHSANFGRVDRLVNFVYLAGTLDAAIWGAELARGDGPGRVYVVEPTGPIEDDPNLTNARFPGNPTKSYRSQGPLRITGEVTAWRGHSPEAIKAMKAGVARLEEEGVEPED